MRCCRNGFVSTSPKSKSSLPAPEQILSTYIDALGGEQALRRMTARKITATTEVPADVRAVGPAVHALTQQYFKAPNQWVITSQTAGGTTSSGFDGAVAWRQDARGVVTETTGAVPAPPLSRVKRTADFYEPSEPETGLPTDDHARHGQSARPRRLSRRRLS